MTEQPAEQGAALPAAPKAQYEINIEAITWADYELFDSDSTPTNEQIAQLFDRIIAGGRGAVPLVHTKRLMREIARQIREYNDPN